MSEPIDTLIRNVFLEHEGTASFRDGWCTIRVKREDDDPIVVSGEGDPVDSFRIALEEAQGLLL